MESFDLNLVSQYKNPQLFAALPPERQAEYLQITYLIEGEIELLDLDSPPSGFYISTSKLRQELFASRRDAELFPNNNYILLYTAELQDYRVAEAERLQVSSSWSGHTRLTQAEYQFVRANYPTRIATLAGQGNTKKRYYNLLARLAEFRV